MSNPSDLSDLLETARAELLHRLRPQLAAEERYVAAMIARAMQLAARELEIGAVMRERERRALATLPGAPDGDLGTLRRWLVATIRRGGFDGSWQRLEAALDERLAARLAIASPEHGENEARPSNRA